jgi:murein DD-endopeptidase MepM/ murein hydrolase activator NlpD
MDTRVVPTNSQPAVPDQTIAEQRQEIRRLAQEFEALLMTQTLRGMRQAMLDEDEQESGLGASTLFETNDVELARVLSRAGGFGLADALLNAFERQVAPRGLVNVDAVQPPSGPRVDGDPGPGPRVRPDPLGLAAGLTEGAPVSSAFGWRTDPFTGSARFHQGIDIAVAYGTEVRAAAHGRVTFSGVQSGYGNTVVIDHGGGRQTRYAHLADAAVVKGQLVNEGQVLGRSGSSGRTTGPHLHFEVLLNGKPVDPAWGGGR